MKCLLFLEIIETTLVSEIWCEIVMFTIEFEIRIDSHIPWNCSFHSLVENY